jgi:hypothetical protein
MSSNKVALQLVLFFGLAAAQHVSAAADLAKIQAQPERGQSDKLARRDRYECHNWAVSQTGRLPVAQDESSERDKRLARAERVERVITGAGIGATVGSLVRATQHENTSHGALAGGAIGAAVGALIGRNERDEDERAEYEDYFQALSACLERRGYRVTINADAGGEAK